MRIQSSQQNIIPRWVWTEGLEELGQTDVAVPLLWPAEQRRDQEVRNILIYIAQYVTGQPRRLQAGETLHYGWMTLQFVEGEDAGPAAGKLVIEEVSEPLSAAGPIYVPGLARTVELVLAQDDVMRRNRLSGEAEYPHRSALAVVCKRVPPLGVERPDPLVLERIAHEEPQDSGWIIRCADPAHNHDDPQELAQTPLAIVVDRFPQLLPYLALPVGTLVSFGSRQVILFPPGEKNGKKDPGSPLQWALRSA